MSLFLRNLSPTFYKTVISSRSFFLPLCDSHNKFGTNTNNNLIKTTQQLSNLDVRKYSKKSKKDDGKPGKVYRCKITTKECGKCETVCEEFTVTDKAKEGQTNGGGERRKTVKEFCEEVAKKLREEKEARDAKKKAEQMKKEEEARKLKEAEDAKKKEAEDAKKKKEEEDAKKKKEAEDAKKKEGEASAADGKTGVKPGQQCVRSKKQEDATKKKSEATCDKKETKKSEATCNKKETKKEQKCVKVTPPKCEENKSAKSNKR